MPANRAIALHPFGKEPEYAEERFGQTRAVLTDGEYPWNDPEIRAVTMAKLGLHLWQLAGRTDATTNTSGK